MLKCLRGLAPAYLADCCNNTSLVPGRLAWRSVAHGDTVIPGLPGSIHEDKTVMDGHQQGKKSKCL